MKPNDIFLEKNIILVGNSVEIMNYELGDFIDSHDVVVRFGKALDSTDTQKKAIGKKTDVWVTGEFRSHMLKDKKIEHSIKNADVLFNRARINLDRALIKIPQLNNRVHYDMYSDSELKEIYKSFSIENNTFGAKRLSAGLLTIMWLCNKVNNFKSLTIIGFDFFAKSTSKLRGGSYYPNSWHRSIMAIDKGHEVHDHKQEYSIVKKYVDEGKVKWIILSDLKPKVIDNTLYGEF